MKIDGIYKGQINQLEIKEVIIQARELMERYPDESMGIVAINRPQMERIREALEKREISQLKYQSFKPEVKYSDNSRVDFLLSSPNQHTYLEVKSVTLVRERGIAEFPDSITKRGSKHLEDLSNMVASGHKAVLLFLCMRGDVDRVRIAEDLDSIYYTNIKAALKSGVQLICYDSKVTKFGVSLGKPIEFEI